jgi:hypothetical protein
MCSVLAALKEGGADFEMANARGYTAIHELGFLAPHPASSLIQQALCSEMCVAASPFDRIRAFLDAATCHVCRAMPMRVVEVGLAPPTPFTRKLQLLTDSRFHTSPPFISHVGPFAGVLF